jgi:ribosomal protein S27E
MFKFIRDIQDLLKRVEDLEYFQKFLAVKKEDLHLIQDKICKHKNWEELGMASTWRDVRCKDCGKVTSLACTHGGSIACDSCVDHFIKEAKKQK